MEFPSPSQTPVNVDSENLIAVQELLSKVPACQFDEFDTPSLVITHEPEYVQTLGSLHPDAFLFMRSIDLHLAKKQHKHFLETIRKYSSALTLTVREILLMGSDDMRNRALLEDLACESIQYVLAPGLKESEMTPEEAKLLSAEYKIESLRKMTPSQLVDVIMSQPTVVLESPVDKHMVSHRIVMEPLTNLTFTRDQQITTPAGVVIGSLKMVQRKMETKVMEFVFDKIGIKPIGKIPAESGATLEGGDYLPAGKELGFIGVGLRTNMKAVEYMLENNLFGSDRVCVVVDDLDKDPERMHLDTVFGLLDKTHVIVSDDIIGKESKRRRTIIEYTYNTETKKYDVTESGTEFTEYLTKKGFHIIPIPAAIQLILGCNIFPLGNGRVIITNEEAARIIMRDRSFTGSIFYVPFTEIIAMSGGVHCATFCTRTPRPGSV